MWAPEDLVDAQAAFQEFLTSSGQTCDIWRPTEGQDALGATTRTFPTKVADDVPCVVIFETGALKYEDLADKSSAEAVAEILLPLTVNPNVGDQIKTDNIDFLVRRLDEINTHSLVQHVWAVYYGRTA